MKKYNVIYIDTPWHNSEIKRSYIENFDLGKMVDENAILLFWFPLSILPDCLELMERWGFEYLAMLTWKIPKTEDARQLFRSYCEHCFVGIRGQVSGFGWHFYNLFEIPEVLTGQKPERFRWMMANWGQEAFSNPKFLDVFGAHWRRKDPGYGADIWNVLSEKTFIATSHGASEVELGSLHSKEDKVPGING
jgi:N6-adenosine-specific RNA methylase IME4